MARFMFGVGVSILRRSNFISNMRTSGPVVRLAPNRLIFNSAAAVHDIHNNPRVTKGRAYTELRQAGGGTPNILNTIDKEAHRKKRRLIGLVVSERSMRVFEPEMSRQIDVFLLQLLRSSQQKQPVNMTPRCERLGVDVVGQLAFGYPLSTQTEPKHRAIIEGIKTRSDRSSLYYFWDRLHSLERLFDLFSGRKTLDRFYESVRSMIQMRMAVPRESKHDFYALVYKNIGPGEPGLISAELWAEAVFFVAAGGSTTATAMSGVFFYLARHPSAYARLATEIRTTFSTGGGIQQGPQLSSCKYLRAVIDETMRMSPSTLAPAWREQVATSAAAGEPFIVDGHVIPPGTQVAISQYSLQHNATYFPEPFLFKPERWLPSDTPDQHEVLTTMQRIFVPFSVGDRSCIGKSMAYLEISLVLAKTLWYFDFHTPSGAAGKLGEGTPGNKDGRGRPDEFQLYDSIVVDHDGPNLVFTMRGDYWREIELEKRD